MLYTNEMLKLLTLTTDFGLHDPYVGEMKGVLAACSPGTTVVDLTHHVDQGDLTAASFVLAGSFRYFPERTLHLAVVDPGVGTSRDILLVRTEHYAFVGPDNGVLFEAAASDGVEEVYALDPARLEESLPFAFPGNRVVQHILRGGISATFHGRDLFIPFCAYLLEGHPRERVTVLKKAMARLDIPRARLEPDKIAGEVVYIDGFGNLISNIPGVEVGPADEVFIRRENQVQSVGALKHTYASVRRGDALALIGSRGYLEIGVNGGSAREKLGVKTGNGVMVMKGLRRV